MLSGPRRHYDAVVRDYNTKLQSFPTDVGGGMFIFPLKQFFQVVFRKIARRGEEFSELGVASAIGLHLPR